MTGLDIDDDRVVEIDQVVGGAGEDARLFKAPVHFTAGSEPVSQIGQLAMPGRTPCRVSLTLPMRPFASLMASATSAPDLQRRRFRVSPD